MNILLIGQSYWPRKNGISTVLTTLAEGLARRGHAVDVATEHEPARQATTHRGVRIHSFRVSGNGMTGMRGEVAAFRQFVEAGCWDLQHHHACQIWSFDALADWLPRRQRPVVVTPHGFSQLNNPAWRPYFEQFRQLLEHVDAVTCLSETFEEVPFLKRLGYARYEVVGNGVDRDEVEKLPVRNLRRDWGLSGRFWTLNVSNHLRLKGHRTLYDLARRVPDMEVVNVGNPHYPERFGLGRLRLKSPCTYECALQAKLIPNFWTKPGSDRQTVLSAYRQADVFVLPSAREASPVVLLEAMAAGLPWVSFDVGDVREHRGGLVVSSVEEMAEAVQAIQHDRALARGLAEAGASHVRARHDLEKIVGQYAALYQRLVALRLPVRIKAS